MTITLQYDLLNRLTKAIHPLGYESLFEYDAVGRITRAVSHLGEGWYQSSVSGTSPICAIFYGGAWIYD